MGEIIKIDDYLESIDLKAEQQKYLKKLKELKEIFIALTEDYEYFKRKEDQYTMNEIMKEMHKVVRERDKNLKEITDKINRKLKRK